MIKLDRSNDMGDFGFYRAKITFSGTSDWIYMQSGNPTISAAIHPTSGTAKVQYTLSSSVDIEAGNARWIDWDKGANSVPTADSLIGSVVAVRGVNVTATSSVLEVVAQ